MSATILRSLKLSPSIVLVVSEHEKDPAEVAPGSLSQILCLANRCASAPAAQSGEAAGTPAAAPAPGGLDEPAAHALLAEHFDEVTWLLAAVRG